jgi:addiction module HigA family antidote
MAVLCIHPSQQLAEELKTLDMSAAELARKIDVPTNRITQILNGTRAITGDTALRVGHTSSGRAHSFGSTWRPSMSCGAIRRRRGKQSTDFLQTTRLSPRVTVEIWASLFSPLGSFGIARAITRE